MKTFIAAAALALLGISSAQADIVATQANRAGGTISLTDDRHDNCARNLYMVLSTLETGQVVLGCWRPYAGKILIDWESGRSSMFETADFTLTAYAHKRFASN